MEDSFDAYQKSETDSARQSIDELWELDGLGLEEATSATLRMVRSIFDSMGDGVLVTDAMGRLRFYNRGAEEILKLPLAALTTMSAEERIDAVGNYLADGVTPFPIEDLPTMRALRGLDSDQVEIFIRNRARPEGVWVSTTARPLRDSQGQVRGSVMVFRDITAARQAREENLRLRLQMVQSQKLESLGLLAGGIAHDFNNLLMGVLGNAGLALLEEEMDATLRTRIQHMKTAATRLADLTNQLLAYSGQGAGIEEVVDLRVLVHEMQELLRTVISKRARIVINTEEAIPSVRVDATQLRQVVMNLITNASDALQGEIGRISISMRMITVDEDFIRECIVAQETIPGEYLALEVEDTGIGMESDTIQRIFDPFFTTKIKGRGLGLAAVLGLVRRHKGLLRVQSTRYRGTVFQVLFPPEKQVFCSIESAVERTPVFSDTGTILIIDDEEVVRDVAEQMLRYAGFEVLAAENGQRGIDLFSRHRGAIRAVLLDLTMPDMGGDKVLLELSELDPCAKIIVSSGYSEIDISSLFTEAKPAGYLQKPYLPDALLQKLEEVLD